MGISSEIGSLLARILPTFVSFNLLCYLRLAVCRRRGLSISCPLAGRIVAESDSYLRFDPIFLATRHALVSSLRGRHVDVDPGSHGLTQPHPLGSLKLEFNLL